MQRTLRLLLLVTSLTAGSPSFAAAPPTERPSFKTIELPAEVLGEEWQRMPGLRIDDFVDLSAVPKAQREMVQSLGQQLTPLGVEAAADYTLVTNVNPGNVVTVRAYFFTSEEKCAEFFDSKYKAQEAASLYRAVTSDAADDVFDSEQTNKRIYRVGNLWVTSHQLGEGDEHITAAEHMLPQLLQVD